jgi:succinyl-diaminopimelate desuccinylase
VGFSAVDRKEVRPKVKYQVNAPYTLSGATYAHVLPNALVFGMNGCKKPEGFPDGHGGAHGADELVSLERLERAMKIYARALLALNGMEW